MTALIAILGACVGLGLLMVLDAFSTTPPFTQPSTRASLRDRLPADFSTRLIRAAAGGFLLGVATRWPIAVVGGAGLGWWIGDIVGGGAARRRDIARTEAIASWTEMLRDTISGAHGLEETIVTSAHVAPDPIRPEVVGLAAALERQPLDVSLRRFAADLSHPTADLVVAALSLAAGGSVRELGELLGTLAVAARDETGMYLRVDAARARMRTAVRVITGSTIATAVGLALINRPYLRSYDDVAGQLVLGVVAVVWAMSLWWLSRMSGFVSPERFFATVEEQA